MTHKFSGGCAHITSIAHGDPIDKHTCHCSVCKRVTTQPTTHVVFFNHEDIELSSSVALNRQPFNAENPDGPLELCTCSECGTPIMLDDKEARIRAIVPNLMGYNSNSLASDYHAFYDPSTGVPKPDDGLPVHSGLRPDFVWPVSRLSSVIG